MAKLIQPLLDVEAAAATFAIADGYSAEVFVKPGTEAGKERGRSKLKEA